MKESNDGSAEHLSTFRPEQWAKVSKEDCIKETDSGSKEMANEKDFGTMNWKEHQKFILDVYVSHEQVIKTKEAKCWIPRYCFLTGKNLFLDRATKLTRRYNEMRPREETIWVDSKAYLMFLLKKGQHEIE